MNEFFLLPQQVPMAGWLSTICSNNTEKQNKPNINKPTSDIRNVMTTDDTQSLDDTEDNDKKRALNLTTMHSVVLSP